VVTNAAQCQFVCTNPTQACEGVGGGFPGDTPGATVLFVNMESSSVDLALFQGVLSSLPADPAAIDVYETIGSISDGREKYELAWHTAWFTVAGLIGGPGKPGSKFTGISVVEVAGIVAGCLVDGELDRPSSVPLRELRGALGAVVPAQYSSVAGAQLIDETSELLYKVSDLEELRADATRSCLRIALEYLIDPAREVAHPPPR
jgi:hypothetical protein